MPHSKKNKSESKMSDSHTALQPLGDNDDDDDHDDDVNNVSASKKSNEANGRRSSSGKSKKSASLKGSKHTQFRSSKEADGGGGEQRQHADVLHDSEDPFKHIHRRKKRAPNQALMKKMQSHRDQTGMSMSWHNLTMTVEIGKKKERATKKILYNVSGHARAGHFLAVMGPSGAGKTSLLNTLAGRVSKGVGLDGYVRVNDAPFTEKQFKKISGFVEQDDLFLSYLTVRETLRTVAKLRLPKTMNETERFELVEGVIDELGLTKAADTIVGSSLVRGISGGERKRLAIGAEMLGGSQILFLDEPTSGLDSASALNVVETLRELAEHGRTVIATIHQPRSNIFALFDSLLLLGEGRVLYFGPARDVMSYFSKLGFPCPRYTNPADHILDIAAVDTRGEEAIAETTGRVEGLIAHYEKTPLCHELAKVPRDRALQGIEEFKRNSSWWREFSTLLVRASRNLFRDKARTVFRVVQSIIVGILISFIFFDLDTDQTSIQDRSGVLFFLMLNQSFGGLFAVLNTFIDERAIFRRERGAGYYRVSAYFLSKNVAELPMSLLPILFGAVVYFIIGLKPTVGAFFTFLLILYAVAMVAESMALAIAAVSPNVAVANGIAPLILVLYVVIGGFYINPDSIPVYFLWLKYISFINYGYEAFLINEFGGRELYCKPDQFQEIAAGANTTATICPFTRGEQVLKTYSAEPNNQWPDILILFGMVVVYRTLAYVILRKMYRGFTGNALGKPLSERDTDNNTEFRDSNDPAAKKLRSSQANPMNAV